MPAKRNRQQISRLQEVVLFRVAEFIADPDDFFAFLQAIGPANLQEPHNTIWELQELEIKHSDLWPSLRITDKLSNGQLEELKDCVKHYPVVRVEGMGNVEWLQQHMPPTTEVRWTLPANKLPSSKWNCLKSFQTSRVCTTLGRYDRADALATVLSELPHLKALDIRFFEFDGIESILSFAANSKHLAELQLSSRFEYHDDRMCLTETMVENITKWFRRQPVREFRVHHWGIDADDDQDEWAQELCETIFNCPMLDSLAFVHCYLNGIDFANCSFQMRSLEIRGGMDRQTSESLVNQLAGSKVTQFKWVPDSNDAMAELEHLFRILPFTSIQELDLSYNKFSNAQWGSLATLLETSSLETLTLRHCQLTHEDVVLLAPAIRNNKTIREVDLYSNNFGFEAACSFIECVSDPKRSVCMKTISVGGKSISDEDMVKLEEFVARIRSNRRKGEVAH